MTQTSILSFMILYTTERMVVIISLYANQGSSAMQKTDFIKVGNNPMLFSEDQINKMDDNLAHDIFSAVRIHKCIECGRKDLALMLLPTTLLYIYIRRTSTQKRNFIVYSERVYRLEWNKSSKKFS